MAAQSVPIDAALDGVREVQFETADVLRRAQGHTLQAVGFGPEECPYRVVASGPFWVLRDYGEYSATQCVLIVVRLLEWLPASRTTRNNGLAEYVRAIDECVVKISGGRKGRKPFLLGHSLGGALAAIFAAMAPGSICGLVLLRRRCASGLERADSGTLSCRSCHRTWTRQSPVRARSSLR